MSISTWQTHDFHCSKRRGDYIGRTLNKRGRLVIDLRGFFFTRCRIDAREKPVTKAQHSSDSGVFGPRAYFRTAFPSPAVLVIEDIKRHDAATYRCRVDFRKGQTRSFRYNLTVIGKSFVTIFNISMERGWFVRVHVEYIFFYVRNTIFVAKGGSKRRKSLIKIKAAPLGAGERRGVISDVKQI